jgi:hypothetical protein
MTDADHTSLLRRFEAKVEKTPSCWNWLASLNTKGYGYFKTKTQKTAHRFSYEFFVGPITDGLHVLHKCDNPRCVNPDHLYLGTNRQNMLDRVERNRNRPVTGEAHHRSKLTVAQVIAIRNDPRPQRVIAADYGMQQPQIGAIKRRAAWTHI